MGRRGPKPDPAAKKKARGNPGKRPLKPEPNFGGSVGDPPDHLDEVARAKWHELVEIAKATPGLLQRSDRDHLALYCETWSDYLAACREVEAFGYTVMTESGSVYQHPSVGIRNKARATLRQLGADMGLNPSARSNVQVAGDVQQDDLEELEAQRDQT